MIRQIEQWVQQACEELGYQLYLFDVQSSVLKVYIDKDDQGIGVQDCEKVSKRIYLFLEAQNIAHQFQLEVSSPGLDRKLKEPWHFQKVLGKNIFVRAKTLDCVSQSVQGVLTQVNENGIVIENQTQMCQFLFSDIKSAHLVCDFRQLSQKNNLSTLNQ